MHLHVDACWVIVVVSIPFTDILDTMYMFVVTSILLNSKYFIFCQFHLKYYAGKHLKEYSKNILVYPPYTCTYLHWSSVTIDWNSCEYCTCSVTIAIHFVCNPSQVSCKSTLFLLRSKTSYIWVFMLFRSSNNIQYVFNIFSLK